MKKLLTVLATAVIAASCGAGGGDTQAAADTLSRGQKDSIIADLLIPEALGVGAANAPTESRDTIR
ncbi:MAG: hypothetical protein OSA81_08210 [Longimicrobiales bacterium]|nr:hypothetical protein [Longimicrobiales bacterium]